jgi:hypothetical protein
MADALDTVNKLMALALNNPNAEEARSAALKAVQMIREHKLSVCRVTLTQTPPAPNPSRHLHAADVGAGAAGAAALPAATAHLLRTVLDQRDK